jgi:hypothetical protein
VDGNTKNVKLIRRDKTRNKQRKEIISKQKEENNEGNGIEKTLKLIKFPGCYFLVLYYKYWSIYCTDFRPKQVFIYCNIPFTYIILADRNEQLCYVKLTVALDGISKHLSVIFKFNILKSFISEKGFRFQAGFPSYSSKKQLIHSWGIEKGLFGSVIHLNPTHI